MLIVSQDRNSIYNFNNVKSIGVLENEIYITDNILKNKGVRIGYYKTEKRAQEVLQEILNRYGEYNLDNNNSVTTLPKIYHIPKE